MTSADDHAPASADLGMAWAIKESFLRYLVGLGDARWSLSGGAAFTSTGELYFPFAEASGDRRMSFAGSVSVIAHFGALQLVIDRPEIELGPGGRLRSHGVDLVRLDDVQERDDDEEVSMWYVPATYLSAGAVPLFGGVYAIDEPFAPLTLRVPRAP
jgi:hypothetical protein